MATACNRVLLAGTLARDAEMRYTARGDSIARITLSIARPDDPKADDRIPLEIRGPLTVKVEGIRRGRAVLVEGRIRIGSTTLSSGRTGRAPVVEVTRLSLLD